MEGFWRAGLRPAALFLTVLLSVARLPAQVSEPGPGASVPGVHGLAQQVDRHYNRIHSLQAEFTESYTGMGVERNEGGTLLLEKPGRMRWNYTSPKGKVFLLDGKYAWFYKQDDPQAQRIEAKKLDDLRSPLRYLLGHAQLEKEMDHLAMAPAANGEYTLTGQPKGEEDRIARVELTVTRDGAITGIEIDETDGAETRFHFVRELDNVPMAASEFRFVPPPGVTVVDALPPV